MYHTLKRIPGTKTLIKRYTKSITKYNNKTNYVTDHSSQHSYTLFGKYGFHEKTDFEPSQKVKFEDIEINIQKNYDKILKAHFGDYMTLPPEEERYNHSDYIIDFGEY